MMPLIQKRRRPVLPVRAPTSGAGAVTLALVCGLAGSGCGDAPPHEQRGPDVAVPAGSPWIRPGDGLLERPDLQALVDAQNRREPDLLVEALASDDPAVRARAALGLASIGDPGTLQALLDRLDDPDPGVRRDVAFALGRIGGYGVARALLEALGGEGDPEVQEAMAQAVASIGEESDLDALVSAGREGRISPWATGISIARFGMRGIHSASAGTWLRDHLAASDPSSRLAAAYFFSRVPVQFWTRLLPSVRESLAASDAADPAAQFLALGLGNAGLPEDEALLVTVMRSATDWRTRVNAALGLGPARPVAAPETRGALFQALQDPSPRVRVAAALALAAKRELPPTDLDRIRELVVASDPNEWQVPAILLPSMARAGEYAAVVEWMDRVPVDRTAPRISAVDALALAPDAGATEALVALSADPSAPVAGAAMRALARRWTVMARQGFDPAEAFGWFLPGLSRSEFAVVFPAASALAQEPFLSLGAGDSLLVAMNRLNATEGGERGASSVLVALGRIGDERVRPLALEAVRSDVRAIASAGDQALQGLGDAPRDFGPDVPWRRSVDWDRLGELGRHPVLVLETERGTIRLRMDAELAPLTVSSVSALAMAGRYDGVPFHRVEPNFVIQGGDVEFGLGYGGPGYSIRTESTPEPFSRGTAGIASAGKDTEGSQFFINHVMSPHLDGNYTVFGWVTDGMEVVDGIRRADPVVRAWVEPDPAGGG
jgi:peptidylprolyl isomerase